MNRQTDHDGSERSVVMQVASIKVLTPVLSTFQLQLLSFTADERYTQDIRAPLVHLMFRPIIALYP